MRAALALPASALAFSRTRLREVKAVSVAEKKAEAITRRTRRTIIVVILEGSIGTDHTLFLKMGWVGNAQKDSPTLW